MTQTVLLDAAPLGLLIDFSLIRAFDAGNFQHKIRPVGQRRRLKPRRRLAAQHPAEYG
jgi:hypothetical protein